ncbi:hypothetical protein CC80DRAFT_503904 [Byssothecium circinans]|uniref:Uncharacterized protein n=1 Tax=Byssothecium circinans TaxID=147558 RepID=A0A6A5TZ24_9PLEO|nr:hypothetical protein CC80DRAFT_503904 [Byssothecium circinans]
MADTDPSSEIAWNTVFKKFKVTMEHFARHEFKHFYENVTDEVVKIHLREDLKDNQMAKLWDSLSIGESEWEDYEKLDAIRRNLIEFGTLLAMKEQSKKTPCQLRKETLDECQISPQFKNCFWPSAPPNDYGAAEHKYKVLSKFLTNFLLKTPTGCADFENDLRSNHPESVNKTFGVYYQCNICLPSLCERYQRDMRSPMFIANVYGFVAAAGNVTIETAYAGQSEEVQNQRKRDLRDRLINDVKNPKAVHCLYRFWKIAGDKVSLSDGYYWMHYPSEEEDEDEEDSESGESTPADETDSDDVEYSLEEQLKDDL